MKNLRMRKSPTIRTKKNASGSFKLGFEHFYLIDFKSVLLDDFSNFTKFSTIIIIKTLFNILCVQRFTGKVGSKFSYRYGKAGKTGKRNSGKIPGPAAYQQEPEEDAYAPFLDDEEDQKEEEDEEEEVRTNF